MQTVFLVMLFVFGACLGSFLCCQARRLHLKTAKPKTKNMLGPRSICLSCHHQLKWYDNLPIISWLFLGGKCRYCHRKIGSAEILSELGLGLSFLSLGTTIDITANSPITWCGFAILLIFTSIVGFLAVYDGLYGELPAVFLYLAITIATASLIVREISTLSTTPFTAATILDSLFSILILGGVYLALYLISRGKWVGDGDWLLATAIAITLSHPWLAINTLFIANLIACMVALPLVKGKKSRLIHLGPFLVIGFVIVYSASGFLFGLIGV